VPELLVANKSDAAAPDTMAEVVDAGAVPVSAATGEGVDKLLEVLGARLRALNAVVELSVPYDRGDVVAALHRDGEVLVEVHDEQATRIRARLSRRTLERFREYIA
ncbi:MAG TPA: GTPase HflX, partial [Acidimicrobiia bacterium]|nr:GTPase HflX [Acidimicrobiia bacterium]